MRTMHLFAGVGGGLLCDLILGHEPIVAVEWDKYACAVLRERAAEGWFPGLHVWEGDVKLFDPSEYVGRVDCIHAGFPCQDISVAGKRAGVSEGTRSGLYREVLRIAGIVRPRYLFLENVAAIISNGLGTVLADLAAMGYDCRWLCIRASDVGAPHHRDRWFLLADAKHRRIQIGRRIDDVVSEDSRLSGICGDYIKGLQQQAREVLADSFSNRRTAGRGDDAEHDRTEFDADGQFRCAENVPDPDESQPQGNRSPVADEQEYGAARGYGGRTAIPGLGELADEFPHRLCADWWEIEPEIGRVARGVSNRVGQLRGYGNAQVPIQAAVAWRLLGGE